MGCVMYITGDFFNFCRWDIYMFRWSRCEPKIIIFPDEHNIRHLSLNLDCLADLIVWFEKFQVIHGVFCATTLLMMILTM